MQEYPQKDQYKLNEICQYTDTQPYVLRFWESEFPQLSPERSSSGQPIYRKQDIDIVRRIKQLLYEDECTLDGARERLESELKRGGRTLEVVKKPKSSRISAEAAPSTSREQARSPGSPQREPVAPPAPPAQPRLIEAEPPEAGPSVSRRRYEDAVDEIDHLRLKLKAAEKAFRKAEIAQEAAEDLAERYRVRALKAGSRIEKLLDTLSSAPPGVS